MVKYVIKPTAQFDLLMLLSRVSVLTVELRLELGVRVPLI